MSNFKCEKCGAVCQDSEKGYVTGCEHYPADIPDGAPASELWTHMAETHDVHLLQSEEVDIRNAANADWNKDRFALLNQISQLETELREAGEMLKKLETGIEAKQIDGKAQS